MSSSSVIRHHDFRPSAVVVGFQGALAAPRTEDWRPGVPSEDAAEHPNGLLTEQARRQAAEMIVQAESEAEALKVEAREAGWQEGYREGLAAGEAASREAVDSLSVLASRARADAEGLLQSAEPEVVALALAIARQVVEAELTLSPSHVEAMAKAALQAMADATVTRVRVHPSHLPILAERWQSEVPLVADAELAPGDCVVDSARGTLDARIETKLEEIAHLLRDVRRGEEPCPRST